VVELVVAHAVDGDGVAIRRDHAECFGVAPSIGRKYEECRLHGVALQNFEHARRFGRRAIVKGDGARALGLPRQAPVHATQGIESWDLAKGDGGADRRRDEQDDDLDLPSNR
jgi:hypothetical protein